MRRSLLLSLLLSLSLTAGCSDDSAKPGDGSVKVDGKVPGGDGTVKPDGAGPSVKGSACMASCTTDSDCPTKGATGFTYKCNGSICTQVWCGSAAECKIALLPACIDNGFAKGQCMPKSCNTSACATGEECSLVFPGYKGCMPAGTPVSCKVDADCVPPDFSPGQTKCVDGYCSCESDQACQSAKTGAGLDGTWKCVPFGASWKELP